MTEWNNVNNFHSGELFTINKYVYDIAVYDEREWLASIVSGKFNEEACYTTDVWIPCR